MINKKNNNRDESLIFNEGKLEPLCPFFHLSFTKIYLQNKQTKLHYT